MWIILFLMLFGCGDDYAEKENANDSQKFKDIKPLIEKHCSSCHNGGAQQGFANEKRWNNSGAKQRIQSGDMPRGSTLNANDKSTFLASFN